MARRHILHIKSGKALDDKMYGVISQPKIPSPDQIEPGEIAVNYADGVETISTLSVGVNQENEIERKVVTFSSDRALHDVEEAVATAIVGLDTKIENNAQDVSGQISVVYDTIKNKEKVTSAALNDLNNRKLDKSDADRFLTVESDPVFTSSAAYSISAEDIDKWNGAGLPDLIVGATSGWVCDTDFQTIVDAHKSGRQVYFRYPGAPRDNHAGQTINSPALIPLKKVTEDDGEVEGEVEFSASWFEPKFDTFVQYTIFVGAEGNGVSQSFTAADPLLKATYNVTNPILSLDKASCPFDFYRNSGFCIRVLLSDGVAINTSQIRIPDFGTIDIKEFVNTLSKTGERIGLKEINMHGGETVELEFNPAINEFVRKNYMRVEGAAASDESVSGVSYNSQTQKIEFTNSSGEIIDEIVATDFIKDGMVSNASVVGGDIVITFNTDAGKEDIHIPITSIVTVDTELTENGTNPVQGGAIYAEFARNELVVSSALNDLNDRKLDSDAIAEWAKSDVKPTYTYDEVGAMPNTTKYAASIEYDPATHTFSLYDQDNVSMDSTTLTVETVVDDTTMTSTNPATTKAVYEAIEEAARVASAGINQNRESITSLSAEITRLSSLVEEYHNELTTFIEMEGDTLYINQ